LLKSVQGIYRNGKIELRETPQDLDEADVIVTFLPRQPEVDLASRGIAPEQAADLRFRLKTFAEDWERPEMGVYDSH